MVFTKFHLVLETNYLNKVFTNAIKKFSMQNMSSSKPFF